MERSPINISERFAKFSEHWSPKIIAEMNEYQFKLAKLQGEFVWHSHAETDEVFIVFDGSMTIHFRDGSVSVGVGEMFVVPKVVEHKTAANAECQVMVIERAGTINTGDVVSLKTAAADVWI